MADTKQSTESSGEGFTEPSEQVKRKNRVTGYIFLFIVLGIMAIAMITRVYG